MFDRGLLVVSPTQLGVCGPERGAISSLQVSVRQRSDIPFLTSVTLHYRKTQYSRRSWRGSKVFSRKASSASLHVLFSYGGSNVKPASIECKSRCQAPDFCDSRAIQGQAPDFCDSDFTKGLRMAKFVQPRHLLQLGRASRAS